MTARQRPSELATDLGSQRLDVQTALDSKRQSGKKCLVPYLTGGLFENWVDYVRAAVDGGADAIEIGIPFSDPVMDGPIIQQANDEALARGATPVTIADDLIGLDAPVPLIAMTYYNIAFRSGLERFARLLGRAGIAGSILPDLPIDEAGEWITVADSAGIENILLAAPTSPTDRLVTIGQKSRGFVYAVGLLGVTGERDSLARTATDTAARVKEHTKLPVLIGVGIGTPQQAVQASQVADGVVIGSTVVRTMLSGSGPQAVHDLVSQYRIALDEAFD